MGEKSANVVVPSKDLVFITLRAFGKLLPYFVPEYGDRPCFLEHCANQKTRRGGQFKKIVTLLLSFYLFMYLSYLHDCSRGIMFGIVTGLLTGRLRYHHSISGRVTPVLGSLNLPFERYWRMFLRGVKCLGLEGDLLVPRRRML